MKIRGHFCRALVGAWIVICTAAPAMAATPKQVEEAIQKAKTYIYSCQQNGNWEQPDGATKENYGGRTSLIVYALLAAGESPKDPRLAPAIKFIEPIDSKFTYTLGLRCQVWLLMPQPYAPDIRNALQRDAQLLIKGARPDKTLEVPSAFYRYKIDESAWDHSNSQYGVLGVWACEQAGCEVPLKYWQEVDSGWRAHMFSNGSWGYISAGPKLPPPDAPEVSNQNPQPRVSMTAAGIATLFITDDYLYGNNGIDCKGNIVDPDIEAGLNYMADHCRDIFEPKKNKDVFYTLYGIERIGVASGRKYLGTFDWYKEGSDYLVAKQTAEGGWGWHSVDDTAFGLLFLVRGRAAVVMNKLEYDLNMHGDKPRAANWNQRPRDAANVVKWITRQNETPLNWQVVNLKVPPEDLHDAPILYIAGNQALDFTKEELAKLRQFVEEGGLIFANADCASPSFAAGLKKVCRSLFPDYEFRELPASSPIYVNEQFPRIKWFNKPHVEALSNGARELVIFVPTGDPSRFWQTQAFKGHEDYPELLDDIFLYAVSRGDSGGLRTKGDTYIVAADPAIKAKKVLGIARLQYAGNWDPEPGSWRRLAAIVHNNDAVDLNVQTVQLGAGQLNAQFKVAHLTGTFKFSLTDAQRKEIQQFVAGGGMLIIDSCGGSADFSASAEKELAAIFPDNKLADVPLDLKSPVYANGPNLQRVDYRPAARKIVGALRTPRIKDIEFQNRPAVFFSVEDLSCGMVGMPVDGIYGYDPDSATMLMEKLLLFASK